MELCSLYNRLGQLMKSRAAIEDELKSIRDRTDLMTYEDTVRIETLENQFKQVETSIEGIDNRINAKENEIHTGQKADT